MRNPHAVLVGKALGKRAPMRLKEIIGKR